MNINALLLYKDTFTLAITTEVHDDEDDDDQWPIHWAIPSSSRSASNQSRSVESISGSCGSRFFSRSRSSLSAAPSCTVTPRLLSRLEASPEVTIAATRGNVVVLFDVRVAVARVGVVRVVVVLVVVVVVVGVVVGVVVVVVVVVVEVVVVVVDVVMAVVMRVGGCGGLCEWAQRWPNHLPGEHSRRYSNVTLARLVRALSRVQLSFAINCTDTRLLPVLSVSVCLAWRLLAPVRLPLCSPSLPATGMGGTTGAK